MRYAGKSFRNQTPIEEFSGICNLCLEEKIEILNLKKMEPNNTINKRTELVSKCRHGNKRKPPSRAMKK